VPSVRCKVYWFSTNKAAHMSANNTVLGAVTQSRSIIIHTVITARKHISFCNICQKRLLLRNVNQPTIQRANRGQGVARKHKSTSLNLFSHSCINALLGSVPDTLNYNRDCTYAKEFPSQLKTLMWAN
jgi:hypothetical protein